MFPVMYPDRREMKVAGMFENMDEAHLLNSQLDSMSKYLPKACSTPKIPPFLHSLHATNTDQTPYDPHDILDQISASLQPNASDNSYEHQPTVTSSHAGHYSASHLSASHLLSPSSTSFSSTSFPNGNFSTFTNSFAAAAAAAAAAAQVGQENECTPRELEWFAERFKQRRIKLGVTQGDVGVALAHLKLPGVGSLSQSTICRFESLTLSHNNMMALKPVLSAWLDEAERANRMKAKDSAFLPNIDKKRKRTSIGAAEKRSLEAYFAMQPRPSSDKLAAIAEKLDLSKNVVRVWFCNQRQKKKRMKFSVHSVHSIGPHSVGH